MGEEEKVMEGDKWLAVKENEGVCVCERERGRRESG